MIPNQNLIPFYSVLRFAFCTLLCWEPLILEDRLFFRPRNLTSPRLRQALGASQPALLGAGLAAPARRGAGLAVQCGAPVPGGGEAGSPGRGHWPLGTG